MGLSPRVSPHAEFRALDAAEAASVTPDLVVLARMLWGSQDDAMALADLCDPTAFQSKASRALFLALAQHAPTGYSVGTIGPVVQAIAPEAKGLLDRLVGDVGTTAMRDDASHEALAEALRLWGRDTKFSRALEYAQAGVRTGAGYDAVRETLERHLTAIDLAALRVQVADDKAAMAARVAEYLDARDQDALRYGWPALDRKVVPLRPGNFVLVGGTSGSGKSTVLRNMARRFAQRGVRTAMLSFEMTGEEQLPNFACMDTGLDVRRFVEKGFTLEERRRFDQALARCVACDALTLNERSAVTPDWILRTLRRYRAAGHVVLIVDHLHRVQYTRDGRGEIRLAVAEFARSLKSFAVDAGAIVIAGVQYTKMSRHDEPDDQNIREANNILEEADSVLHTWRPLVAGDKTRDGVFVPTVTAQGGRILAGEAPSGATLGVDDERLYLKIGKQRVRPAGGFVALPFNPRSGLIADIADTPNPEPCT